MARISYVKAVNTMGRDKMLIKFFAIPVLIIFIALGNIRGCSSGGDSASADDESLTVEVSFDSTLANINHGDKFLIDFDESGNPIPGDLAYGDAILITGYLYPKGTWAREDGCTEALPMCGAKFGGGPSFPDEQIGEIVCTGVFFANPFQFFIPGSPPQLGEEVGIFFLNLKFGDGTDMLELRGRTLTGFDGSHPAQFSIFGGTGVFKNATGEGLEVMIRPNRSGAFNFEIDLTGVENVSVGQLKKLISGDQDDDEDD